MKDDKDHLLKSLGVGSVLTIVTAFANSNLIKFWETAKFGVVKKGFPFTIYYQAIGGCEMNNPCESVLPPQVYFIGIVLNLIIYSALACFTIKIIERFRNDKKQSN